MKKTLLIIMFMVVKVSFAQDIVLPGDKAIQTKWLKEGNYSMKWYRVKDTMRYEMGTINTAITTRDKKLVIVQNISMNNMNTPWTDSTIADIITMAPVYHSSSNTHRNMAINFGEKIIDVYSKNNATQKTDILKDTVQGKYFDSNIYTTLVSWLPLQEGYTAKLPIYDYNSSEKHGIVYVNIHSVKKGWYVNAGNISEEVFIIELTDGISNSNSTYYISEKNRHVLKIVTSLGAATFEIVRTTL